jgi:hypothetical protein
LPGDGAAGPWSVDAAPARGGGGSAFGLGASSGMPEKIALAT